MERVRAFRFRAGEFLDEELRYIEEKFGKIPFITEGVEIKNPKSKMYPYEWHTTPEAIKQLTQLYLNDPTDPTDIPASALDS